MKKMMTTLLMSVTVLGLAISATGAISVHADESTPTSKTADTNNASLNVTAGALSFTTPETADFGKTSVDAVFNTGLDAAATTDKGTDVSDFLGDKGTWTLSVVAEGWIDSALNADAASKLTLTSKAIAEGKGVLTPTNSVTVATGTAGKTNVDLGYALHIASGTNVSAGTTTNTLNWTLGNQPGANQE